MNYNICSEPQEELNKIIGTGSYGIVYENKHNQAVKIFHQITDKSFYKFDNSMLRELTFLCMMKSNICVPNIYEIYFGKKFGFTMDKLTYDLTYLIASKKFDILKLQYVIFQLVYILAESQNYLILHRDIKPSNILVNDDYSIGLIDWGLGISILSNFIKKDSRKVQTLWYRCPEHLIDDVDRINNSTIDMWSVGVIILELIVGKNGFFKGTDEKEVLHKIIKYIGYPTDEKISRQIKMKLKKDIIFDTDINDIAISHNITPDCFDFIRKCLEIDSKLRLDPQTALSHPFLTNINPIPDILYVPTSLNISLKNLPSYHSISKKYIINKNPTYLNERSFYINVYLKTSKFLNASFIELILFISYTDKIMSLCNMSKYKKELLAISILNISMMVVDGSCLMLDTFKNYIDIDCDSITNDDIQNCICELVCLLNFPMSICTYASYNKLFETIDNAEPIIITFKHLCMKMIVPNIDYIEYSNDVIFGSILNKMKDYEYTQKCNGDNTFLLKDKINNLLNYYTEIIDIEIPSNFRGIPQDLYNIYVYDYTIKLKN